VAPAGFAAPGFGVDYEFNDLFPPLEDRPMEWEGVGMQTQPPPKPQPQPLPSRDTIETSRAEVGRCRCRLTPGDPRLIALATRRFQCLELKCGEPLQTLLSISTCAATQWWSQRQRQAALTLLHLLRQKPQTLNLPPPLTMISGTSQRWFQQQKQQRQMNRRTNGSGGALRCRRRH